MTCSVPDGVLDRVTAYQVAEREFVSDMLWIPAAFG
jgi:hypothetical protein